MSQRLGVFVLAASIVFVGLAFADDPPAQPDDPPVRLKKKDKTDPKKTTPDKIDDGKTPKKDDKKEPKKDDAKEPAEPAMPQEDEAEVLNRVTKNIRTVDEKLANKELGDSTRQLQEDILKDLDSLIRSAENPPPQGGGGEDNKNQAKNSDSSKSNSGGSMNKQTGKQSGGSRGAVAALNGRRGAGSRDSGTQQANQGGQPKGSGQPMPGMGQTKQGQQAAQATAATIRGGGGKSMDRAEQERRPVQGRVGPSARNAAGGDERLLATTSSSCRSTTNSSSGTTAPSPKQGRKQGGTEPCGRAVNCSPMAAGPAGWSCGGDRLAVSGDNRGDQTMAAMETCRTAPPRRA